MSGILNRGQARARVDYCPFGPHRPTGGAVLAVDAQFGLLTSRYLALAGDAGKPDRFFLRRRAMLDG
jgi:hypothetical protein